MINLRWDVSFSHSFLNIQFLFTGLATHWGLLVVDVFYLFIWKLILYSKNNTNKKRQLQNLSDKSCKYSWKWLNDGSCRFYQYLGNEVYLIYIHFFLILVGMAAHSRSSQPSPWNWVVEALALRKSVFVTSSAIFQWRNPG